MIIIVVVQAGTSHHILLFMNLFFALSGGLYNGRLLLRAKQKHVLFSFLLGETIGRGASRGSGGGRRVRRSCGTTHGRAWRRYTSCRRGSRGRRPRCCCRDFWTVTCRSSRRRTSPGTSPIRCRSCRRDPIRWLASDLWGVSCHHCFFYTMPRM